MESGTPGRARTPNLRFRRPTLYPIELRAHTFAATAKKGQMTPFGWRDVNAIVVQINVSVCARIRQRSPARGEKIGFRAKKIPLPLHSRNVLPTSTSTPGMRRSAADTDVAGTSRFPFVFRVFRHLPKLHGVCLRHQRKRRAHAMARHVERRARARRCMRARKYPFIPCVIRRYPTYAVCRSTLHPLQGRTRQHGQEESDTSRYHQT